MHQRLYLFHAPFERAGRLGGYMTTFPEWLGQIGLGHCTQRLLDNGIDFDVAPGLTQSDLRSVGVNLGDSRRLLQALRMKDAALSAEGGAVIDAPSHPDRVVPDEQRQLTVMFCDLVNFTDLSQRIDPEELKSVVRAFRRVCTGVVVHYDGHVAQCMGDGLMVYFGWPAAHEDDPERCVRAALDIVQAVRGELVAHPLAVHVGIATGRVIVGDSPPGGNRDDGLAVGETPNLASRLQGLAAADAIVIGASTRRLIGNTFELTDLGRHTLKGIVQPVQAWRVQAVLRGEGRFDAAHSGLTLTALVGRDEEMAILQRRWSWAQAGEGQVLLLSGEPGIGKSRLTEMLRVRIKGEPHIALRYQCSPFRINSALYPIIEHIELAAGFTGDDTPEQKLDKLETVLAGGPSQRNESAPLLAALLSLPIDRYPPTGLSPGQQKGRTLEVLAGQVEALSRVQPVLMVIEDAHWIDPTTEELLDLWVPRLSKLRVLLILTHRPQYSPRARDYPHASTLVLTGLPQHLGAELVGKVTQGKALPSDVLQQIVAHSDGNPLYLEELTRSVIESQLLREEHDRYTLVEALPPSMVPPTLSASLVERLGRRAGVRELAQIGACLGRQFPHELLAAVSPYTGREFEEELQELTATGLVSRRGTPPDAVYTFKHALVQDAAYDSLLRAKRQQLHERIAEVLSASFPERIDAEPELLAHHHTQAGNLTAAIPFWRRAGESAQARVALQEAVACLRNGLSAVEKLAPSPERDQLELSLREPLHWALRWHGWATPDVGANAESILRLAEKHYTLRSLLIGLWGKWISTLAQGRVAEAPAWARRLLTEGMRRDEIDLQILGHRGSMVSHFYLGELHAACVEGDSALELYDPSRALLWMGLVGNDVRTAVGVYLSQALWMRGDVDRADRLSRQKDADAHLLGDPINIAWALTWGSAHVCDYRHEPDRMLAHAEEAERLARQHGIPLLSNALVPVSQGLARLRMGQPTDAAALLQQGIAAWTAADAHLSVPYMKSALAEARARQGDVDEGLHLVEEALAQIERPGWHERVWLAEALRVKGWLLMRRGGLSEAEDVLRASIVVAREQQAKSWELRSSTTLAELHVAHGQRGAARSLLEPIYRSFTEGFATHDLRAAQALLDQLG